MESDRRKERYVLIDGFEFTEFVCVWVSLVFILFGLSVRALGFDQFISTKYNFRGVLEVNEFMFVLVSWFLLMLLCYLANW